MKTRPRRTGQSPARRLLIVLSALGVAVGAGCGVIEAPAPTIPLRDDVGECLAEIVEQAPDVRLCVYFEGAECVFIGPLQDGAAELGGEGWVRRCPAPEPDFDIQGPKGTVVPAKIFIVEAKEGAADSYCKLPSEGGPGVCDGTLYGGQPGASDCYAQVATNYLIGEDGALEITGENASVTFSGFVGSEVREGTCSEFSPGCTGACSSGELRVGLFGPILGSVSLNPTAATCTSPSCTYDFPDGRCVTLTIQASSTSTTMITGVTLDSEMDASKCPGNPCSTEPSSVVSSHTCALQTPATVAVRFGVPLHVEIIGEGQVTWNGGVGGQELGCSSGATCPVEFYDGTETVTLTATSTVQEFGQWSGCTPLEGSPQRCEVTMDRARDVVALFGQVLELEVVGGNGTVTVESSGETCRPGAPNARCFTTWERGETVTLVASTPDAQTKFIGWSEPSCGSGLSCTITMDDDRQVRAFFVDLEGGGDVEIPEGRAPGDGIVRAVPAIGWVLLFWENCPSSDIALCTMDGSRVGTRAVFGRRLTLAVVGMGGATLDPASDPRSVGSTCGATFTNDQPASATCFSDHRDGTAVRVDFQPGDYAGTPLSPGPLDLAPATAGSCAAGVCNVTLTEPTAISQAYGFNLEVEVAGAGRVRAPSDPSIIDCTPNCTAFLHAGTEVGLTTIFNPPNCFTAPAGWEGCPSASGANCDVLMDRNRTGAAKIKANIGRPLTVVARGPGFVSGLSSAVSNQTLAECRHQAGSVTLQATAVGGVFIRWEGCDGPNQATGTQCVVNSLPREETITAVFGEEVCVNIVGPGRVNGTVTCTSGRCCAQVEPGTAVSIQATPNVATDHGFVTWGNTCPSGQATSTTCAFNLGGTSQELTATFAGLVRVTTQTGGQVTSPGLEISCTAASTNGCRHAFMPSATVRLPLTAVSIDVNYAHYRWIGGGCIDPSNPVCGIFPPAINPLDVTAEFGRPLTARILGNGTLTQVAGSTVHAIGTCNSGATCTGVYPNNSSVTLEASTSVTPAPPLTWVGCDSNPVADQCTVNLTTARSVTATYGTQVTISLAQTGNISGGSIRDNQSPNLINCPTGACSFTYSPGQQIDFSPTNNTNWTFEGFSTATGCPTVLPNGDCRVNTNTSQGFTVGARFRWPLTFTEPIGGSITAPGFACPGACTTSYPADQIPVRVTTNPSSTWDIYTRTGCAPVAGSPFLCDAAPTNTNGAVNVATTFGRPLTLTANQGGSITRTSGQSAVGCSNGATNCYVYPNNASVNLTAVPAAASSRSFLSWTGCSNNNNPCTVIMNDQRTLVADFGFGLTANTVGGGTVTQSSGTQSCGTNCLVHADGTLVTLTASPNSGWDFLGWQNCPGGASGTTCQVTVNAALTVTAQFGRRLTVNVTGSGTVARNPTTGVPCTNGVGACLVYPDPTTVTLTATPNARARFLGWTNCPSANGNICTAVTNADRTVTARFGRRLTVQLNGAGSVTAPAPASINCTSSGGPTCAVDLPDGTPVTLTANPPTGWAMEAWSNNCNATGTTCNITISDETNVSADVRPRLQLNAPTARSGDRVDVAPPGTGSNFPCIGGGSGCTAQARQLPGASVTLSAVVPANRRVVWGGDCASATGTQCPLTMSTPRTATADFGYDLVYASTVGGISLSRAPLSGNQTCAPPSCTVILSTAPVQLTFTGTSTTAAWAGDCAAAGAASNPCTLDMASPKTVSVTGT